MQAKSVIRGRVQNHGSSLIDYGGCWWGDVFMTWHLARVIDARPKDRVGHQNGTTLAQSAEIS